MIMPLKSQIAKEILSRLWDRKLTFEGKATFPAPEVGLEKVTGSPLLVTPLTALSEARGYFRVAERRVLGAIWASQERSTFRNVRCEPRGRNSVS